jgi:hypothetical protein
VACALFTITKAAPANIVDVNAAIIEVRIRTIALPLGPVVASRSSSSRANNSGRTPE